MSVKTVSINKASFGHLPLNSHILEGELFAIYLNYDDGWIEVYKNKTPTGLFPVWECVAKIGHVKDEQEVLEKLGVKEEMIDSALFTAMSYFWVDVNKYN